MSEAIIIENTDKDITLSDRIKELGKTERTDKWWLEPFLTLVGFGLFVLYTAWAAVQGSHYYYEPYLSPFYSPTLFTNPLIPGSVPVSQAILGAWPKWWPAFIPASPAFFILIFPAVFRGTCYYYRKAYYRSLMLTPPACAVSPVKQKNYQGETTLFLFQNLHRYTVYIAVLFIFILAYDAIESFFRNGIFGIGVGSLVITINVLLLSAYTFGCHSIRHFFGGRKNTFGSCNGMGCCSKTIGNMTHSGWSLVSILNKWHMKFAWLSLFWVGFTDFYIRMVSMGIIHDFNTWKGF